MAEAFKVQDSARVVPIKRQHAVVPWAQFEPYWNQLLTSTNSSQNECSKLIGYSTSNAAFWKREDAVPTVALRPIWPDSGLPAWGGGR